MLKVIRALFARDPDFVCQHITPRFGREPEYAGRIVYVEGQLRTECPVCHRQSRGVDHAVRAAAEQWGGAY